MKIKYAKTFQTRLIGQLKYIAQDNKQAANNLRNKIQNRLQAISQMPYQCRQSLYFDDKNIRDLIVDGYTITYQISQDHLLVFGFTKYQEDIT